MSWKDILKNEDREGLEIELEQLLGKAFEEMDENDWSFYSDGNRGPNVSEITINVFFEDNYEGEEDLTDEEKFEAGEGHYRIDFTSDYSAKEFAMADYTFEDGFNVQEYNPEKLDIQELYDAIKGLKQLAPMWSY